MTQIPQEFSVGNKPDEYLSALDFTGLDRTGATDSTAAIQAAATALTSGGRLVIPDGTYLTSSVITLNDNTEVVGRGLVSFTSTTTATNGFAIFQSGNGCSFYNLSFSGTDIDEAGYCAIRTLEKDDILIDNCKTTGGLGEAFVIEDGDNVTVKNCHLYQTNRWSIYVAKMTNVKLLDNYIDGSQTYDGIKIVATLYSDAVTEYTSTNIIVRGNTCINNNRDGIDCASGVDTLIIEGNDCNNNTLNGIETKLPASSALFVQRVSVKGNSCVGNSAHGIRFDDVLRSDVVGNMVTDNGDMGITIDNNSQEIKVADNSCYRNTTHGIRVKGDVTVGVTQDVDVSNNRCIDNGNGTSHGIAVGSYVDDIRVKNNECYQNISARQDFGIVIIGTTSIDNVKIENNYIPADKHKTNSFSRGSWSGANVYLAGNITDSDTFETWADQDATPEVRGGRSYYTANTVSTTITALDQGTYEMGPFTIFINDANTQINHGTGTGNISLSGSANWTSIPSGSTLTLICRNGVFKEIARMAA